MGGGDTKVEETEGQKRFIEILTEKFNYLQGAPMEVLEQGIDAIRNYKETYTPFFAGKANEEVQSAAELQNQNMQANLISRGINPNSGKFTGDSMALNQAVREAGAKNVAAGVNMAEDQYYKGLENIVAIGANQEAQNLTGFGAYAKGQADTAARDVERNVNKRLGYQQTAGQIGGLLYGSKTGGGLYS